MGKNGKNMNLQRISFLSVFLFHAFISFGTGHWLLLHSSYFLLPCGLKAGSCFLFPVTCLFLEGHFGIHLEVASGPFCLLVNSPWPLVFALCLFFFFLLGFNLYCWKGIHFSWSNSLMVLQLHLCLGLIFSSNIWLRDLLREFAKKYEILLMDLFLLFFLFLASEALLFISFFWASFHSLSSPTLGIWPGEGFYLPDPCELTFANTLLLSNAAVSLGNAFISLEISLQFLIFFSLFSFILAWTFVSLQIKEFRVMGLSINDSVSSCLFFFLTGLHFFHLLLGLLLLSLFFGVVVFLPKGSLV